MIDFVLFAQCAALLVTTMQANIFGALILLAMLICLLLLRRK